MKIGILSLQGAFIEHANILKTIDGVESLEVRNREDINNCDGLIIPGGESTTIGKLIERYNLYDILKNKIENGFPVFGTCAGLIILSKKLLQDKNQKTLGVLDVVVKRNAFGRQINSMEIDLKIKYFDSPFRAVFIRAPIIVEFGKDVEVLAELEEGPVFVKQKNIIASSFHPELTNDNRIHKIFIDIINKRR